MHVKIDGLKLIAILKYSKIIFEKCIVASFGTVGKEIKNMAKSNTIKKYKTEIIDNVVIEIPVRDEESKDIIELNFKQYVDVLADIVVRYAANFKAGQAVGLHLCLLNLVGLIVRL